MSQNYFGWIKAHGLDRRMVRAGSESRADFYEQRQYTIQFPPFAGEETVEAMDEGVEAEHAFHLVYAWDMSANLGRVFVKLVCPKDRSGKHEWQHVFPDGQAGSASVPSSGNPSPAVPNIAAAAAAANTDLELTLRDDGKKQRERSASNGA